MRRAIVPFLLLSVGCFDRPKSESGTVTTPAPGPAVPPAPAPAKEEPAVDIGNGQAMFQNFRDNVISASRKWEGKRVRMTNVVTAVAEDKTGFFLTFYSGAKLYPAKAELEAFGKLRRSDQIVAEGTVRAYRGEGADLEITLTDGKFIERQGRVELGP